MVDLTQDDTDLLYMVILDLIVLIPGLLVHSFIIAVNVYDWWKGRSVTAVDHIVTFLGISRMCSQNANMLHFIVTMLLLNNLYSHITLTILDVLCDFFTFSNMWLTALLSMVFCLKIYNLHTRLLLYLRRMIMQRTVYFIGASMLLSSFHCLIIFSMNISEVNKGGTYNTTRDIFLNCTDINPIYTYSIGSFFPLFFYCVSSILLFTLLYQHIVRMKRSSNLTINMETYYSVMRLVSFLFIYNTIYHIVHFICIVYYYFYCVALFGLYITLDILPILHSTYLICRTAKLRNQISKVLRNLTDFLFERQNMETRENVEVIADGAKGKVITYCTSL